MTSLLEIAPRARSEVIEVLGKELEIKGIPLAEFAELLHRFPELEGVMAGGASIEESAFNVKLAGLRLLPPIIAAGVGSLGDKEFEAAAGRLPVDEQLRIFEVVIRLTMPERTVPLGNGQATVPRYDEGLGSVNN
jgi:hypothetical protein